MGSSEPTLVAQIPGALLFRADLPPGTPDCSSDRSIQVFCAKESPVFAGLAPEERVAVVGSVSRTVQRAEYHYLRFREIRAVLDARRATLPGEVQFDALVDAMHCELQAFCGAARTCVDEIVYLIARRHGVPSKKARGAPWAASDLVTQPLPAVCNVPEVVRLRARKSWFETLNAYRNSFYHHGWRYGAGHYDSSNKGRAATSPAMNALLVPDRKSLLGRSKPFEWSWTEGKTVDEVAAEVHKGLDEFLRELCEAEWATPEPPRDTAPPERRFNIIVPLFKPAVITTPHVLVIPFFSTRELGADFQPLCQNEKLELSELPVSALVADKRGISFSLAGFQKDEVPVGITQIECLLDPVPQNAEWRNIVVASRAIVPIAAIEPFSITIPLEGYDRVFIWHDPMLISWSTGLR